MNFVTRIPISTNWKRNNNDSILVIIDRLTKMVHYKPVKIIIDASELAEVVIDMVVSHYGLPNLIVTDRGALFTSKFWSLLCYFLGIKCRLSTVFYLQSHSQTEQQNSIMKAYLQVFVNFKQNNWARLLLMAEFVYNNTKNASTGHMPFELNYSYHLCIFFEKNINFSSQSKTVKELSSKLRELMTVC